MVGPRPLEPPVSPRRTGGLPTSAPCAWSTWEADGSRLELAATVHPHGGVLVTWLDGGGCWLVCRGHIHAGSRTPRLSDGERAAVLATAESMERTARELPPPGAPLPEPPTAPDPRPWQETESRTRVLAPELPRVGETVDLFGRRKGRT